MIKKILIANRGEIAVRIIRACKELGIKTVAVYSETDKNSLHVAIADEAVCIGPGIATKSYLNIKNIIEVACLTNADAIHPGFGFLSENSKFAKICEETNIIFIGPSSKLIDLMGEKTKAKEIMQTSGMPVVPGSEGCIETLKEAIDIASEIGYPVMIKAANGGRRKRNKASLFRRRVKKSIQHSKNRGKKFF